MDTQENLTRSATTTSQRPRLQTAVIRESEGFAALEKEWDELYKHCPTATPFQSWAWLYSWWEHYGKDYQLRLITVRDEDLLVGLIPLMLRYRWGIGQLLFVGGRAITPYKDLLAREGWEQEVAETGVRALKELDGWWVADLRELQPKAAAWGMFRKWDGPRTLVCISNHVWMHVKPWEESIVVLSKNLRKSARKTLRLIEKDRVLYEPAAPEDAEQAARTLVALHRKRWRGRDIDPEHLTRRYEAFIATATRRMIARKVGRISEFRRGDEVLASQLLVLGRDFVGAYRLGANDEASRRYKIDVLGNWDAIDVACRGNISYISLMDGDQPEKLRWASEVVPCYRAIMARWLVFLVPYAGYHILRFRAEQYVHSEQAPDWIKKAMAVRPVLRRIVKITSFKGKEC